jgi:hypothetical protein
LRKYSNIGTDREALFLVRFGFFLVSGQNRHHLKKKERRSNKRERENERERKRERKNEENESVLQPKTQPQQHHFLQRKKNTENFVSQHIMASPEAAAILRELQGKNGNGVRF